jgi:hypothetical protein
MDKVSVAAGNRDAGKKIILVAGQKKSVDQSKSLEKNG